MNKQKQYEFEKRSALRLQQSTREERRRLYIDIYSELYEKFSSESKVGQVERDFKLIKSFFRPSDFVLEVGAGNLALTRKIAQRVKKIVALEVASVSSVEPKGNMNFVSFNGIDFPALANKFDKALSFQVLEHLHPDDVKLHLEAVKNFLKDGGYYIIRTPHRFSGPHDVSKDFSKEATGLHLKEYTYRELLDLTESAGFRRARTYLGQFGFKLWLPSHLIIFIEKYFAWLVKVFVRNLLIVAYK